MVDLPDGVVTFVFTDVQGSTRMWEESPELMMRALEQHDEVIDAAVATHDGVSVKPRGEGDSRFLVFPDACDAVRAMAEIQTGLAAVDWVTSMPVRVRASLHTGTADLQLGDYYGPAVNRAARLRAIAHGGQTVMSRSTWELAQRALTDGVTARDMGEHGLKDLTRPEHVYQLCIEGLPDEFPALTSLDAVPNNLPAQVTELIGRRSELEEVKRLLAQSRLLTILAPGGTGKTRLAIQAAADITAEFPDGVYFVSLADISLSRDIVQTIAESLRLALSSDQDVTSQLLTYLSNKQQLLVFDNFEHVKDGASIAAEILQAAPQVKVLATSREKLNLTGETIFTLGGLETTWATPEDALQSSGVQLFVDAARRARPDSELSPGDLEPLSKILGMTGGIPLGILLAAAWVDMLSVGEIAAEIAKNLDFLETDTGDVPERQRSVRAVFDYSWALLGPEERETFSALSIFRGGFTREAAETVAGATLRTLANLTNKSLVAANPETGRYAVHELLREYAEAELQQDAAASEHLAGAHAAYYRGLADASTTEFVTGDQVHAAHIIENDLDNVRAAWRSYLAAGDATSARRFIEMLWYLHEMRGWYPTAVSLFGEALDALDASSVEPDVARLRAMAGAVQAFFFALMGQPDAGEAAARRGTEIMRESSDLTGYMTAAQCWGISLAYLGRMDEMAACIDAAIVRAESEQSPFWEAAMRNWRSFCAVLTGDIATAATLVPQAYGVFEEQREHFFMTWNLWLQAMMATGQGRGTEAIALHTRQLETAREIGYVRATMVALEGLGEADVAAGLFEDAERAFIEGMATADKMGMVRDMLAMMMKVATVRAATGRPADAVELLAIVQAEPRSELLPFTSNTPIRESAATALNEVRERLDADAYEQALARGTSTSFESAAKALMTGVTTPQA